MKSLYPQSVKISDRKASGDGRNGSSSQVTSTGLAKIMHIKIFSTKLFMNSFLLRKYQHTVGFVAEMFIRNSIKLLNLINQCHNLILL